MTVFRARRRVGQTTLAHLEEPEVIRKIICLLAFGLLAPSFAAAQQSDFSHNFIDVKTATWTGVVVERSCFKKLGLAKATAPDHLACAKECIAKGQSLAVLTDDDGLMNIVGEMAKDKFVKVIPYIGKRVEVTGTSALPTGNYIPRQIDITKIVPEKN